MGGKLDFRKVTALGEALEVQGTGRSYGYSLLQDSCPWGPRLLRDDSQSHLQKPWDECIL